MLENISFLSKFQYIIINLIIFNVVMIYLFKNIDFLNQYHQNIHTWVSSKYCEKVHNLKKKSTKYGDSFYIIKKNYQKNTKIKKYININFRKVF